METVALPVHYSKLGLYKTWCFDRGYNITFSDKHKSKINPKSKWEAVEGVEGMPVISFCSFRRFWDTNNKFLKIRARGEDTCDKCFLIASNLDTNNKKASDEAMERHRRYREEKSRMRGNMTRERLQALEVGWVVNKFEFLDDN